MNYNFLYNFDFIEPFNESNSIFEFNALNGNFYLFNTRINGLINLSNAFNFFKKINLVLNNTNVKNLRYHEGIQNTTASPINIDVNGGDTDFTLQFGDTIYAVRSDLANTNPLRYVVLSNPSQLGYDYTIQVSGLETNAVYQTQLNFDRTTRDLKGPNGGTRWRFNRRLRDFSINSQNGIQTIKIPFSSIILDNNILKKMRLGDSYKVALYNTNNRQYYITDLQTYIQREVVSNSEEYYVYILMPENIFSSLIKIRVVNTYTVRLRIY